MEAPRSAALATICTEEQYSDLTLCSRRHVAYTYTANVSFRASSRSTTSPSAAISVHLPRRALSSTRPRACRCGTCRSRTRHVAAAWRTRHSMRHAPSCTCRSPCAHILASAHVGRLGGVARRPLSGRLRSTHTHRRSHAFRKPRHNFSVSCEETLKFHIGGGVRVLLTGGEHSTAGVVAALKSFAAFSLVVPVSSCASAHPSRTCGATCSLPTFVGTGQHRVVGQCTA